jgi:ketosteroid isomerase-like protein
MASLASNHGKRPETIDPVALLIAYHAAIQRLDFESIEAMFHDDAVYVSAGVGSLKGRTEILRAFRNYFERFPDQVATDNTVQKLDEHAAIARWQLAATDAATGVISNRSGDETVRFNASGKIVSVSVRDD